MAEVTAADNKALPDLLRADMTVCTAFWPPWSGGSTPSMSNSAKAPRKARSCVRLRSISRVLPLSQADRCAAATPVIASHPQMSDRAIARAWGPRRLPPSGAVRLTPRRS
jgi:hypothetical protein